MIPAVDIVIPTKGRPRFLSEAVTSALDQGSFVGQVLIVDDGLSIDLEEEPVDPKVRLLRNSRRPGASGARNTGLEQVTAPWVLFLDDDDLLDPLFLSSVAREVTGHEERVPVAVATGFRIDGAGEQREIRPQEGIVDSLQLLETNLVGPTSFVLCSTSAVRKVAGFDESLPAAQDWDLWIRLAKVGPIRTLETVLGTYRVHDLGQISASSPGTRYRRYRQFFEKRDRLPGVVLPAKSVADELYWWGVLMAWTGDLEGADEALRWALSHHGRHWKARVILGLLHTPLRRAALRIIYMGRAHRMWLDDRREPLPLR